MAVSLKEVLIRADSLLMMDLSSAMVFEDLTDLMKDLSEVVIVKQH